jgi:signal transduction histidine kinase
MMSKENHEKARLLSILKHDMNNVMTGVKTGLEIMSMDDFFDDEDNAEDMNDVKKASVRMANMLEDLSLVYGDDAEARPPSYDTSLAALREKIQDQLGMERIDLECRGESLAEGELKTHSETFIRGLFYGGLLLNELEKGPVCLELSASGKCWSYVLSESRRQKLLELKEKGEEERPAFLLKIAELAAMRLGGHWKLAEATWSLSLDGEG